MKNITKHVLQLSVIMLLISITSTGKLLSQVATETSQSERTADHDNQPINLYAGLVQYQNPIYDSATFLECMFSFNRENATFYPSDSQGSSYLAEMMAQLEIFNTEGMRIDSVATLFGLKLKTEDETKQTGIKIFNRLTIELKPGQYSARLILTDLISKTTGEFFFSKISITEIDKLNLKIGGASFAHKIDFVGKNKSDRLVKNGFKIYPNPVAIFSTEDDDISLYYEIYNITGKLDSSEILDISYTALKRDSSLIGKLGERDLVKTTSSAVLVETFSISGWAPGLYHLGIKVEDYENEISDQLLIPFAVVYPVESKSERVNYFSSADPYDNFSLREKLHLVKYFLNPNQKKTLSILSEVGKENFLEQFWKEHDSVSATVENETRLDLIERYKYSNQYFSSSMSNKDGWETDRGRIIMTYGLWDDIEEVKMPKSGNPFEVWYYRRLGAGKMFVFEDWSNNSDYRLVHSNVYGERFDQNWEDILRQGPRLGDQ